MEPLWVPRGAHNVRIAFGFSAVRARWRAEVIQGGDDREIGSGRSDDSLPDQASFPSSFLDAGPLVLNWNLSIYGPASGPPVPCRVGVTISTDLGKLHEDKQHHQGSVAPAAINPESDYVTIAWAP